MVAYHVTVDVLKCAMLKTPKLKLNTHHTKIAKTRFFEGQELENSNFMRIFFSRVALE